MNNHDKLVVVTGVGFRTKSGRPEGDAIPTDEIRPNIGAAVARRLISSGYSVAIVGRRQENVSRYSEYLATLGPGKVVAEAAMDITDEKSVKRFVTSLPEKKHLWLVQSVGLSSGFYTVNDDNPYRLIEEIENDLVVSEFRIPVVGLLNSLRALIPFWRLRGGGKAVIVNSMSGIRAYPRGGSHATSKGGLHQAIRSATLELYNQNVFVSEINPGIVDTGLYDSETVKSAVREIAAAFGQDLAGRSLPVMNSDAVAASVVHVLESTAHIVQIDLVAAGQFPHIGA